MKELLLLFDGIHFEGGLGMAAFYALFGFLFVFAGIALLIAILTLIGLVMKTVNAKKAEKNVRKNAEHAPPAPAEEGITPEIVAAITAAIAAFTAQEDTKCEFVVRRIKRI